MKFEIFTASNLQPPQQEKTQQRTKLWTVTTAPETDVFDPRYEYDAHDMMHGGTIGISGFNTAGEKFADLATQLRKVGRWAIKVNR